jgi:hypothetical protein
MKAPQMKTILNTLPSMKELSAIPQEGKDRKPSTIPHTNSTALMAARITAVLRFSLSFLASSTVTSSVESALPGHGRHRVRADVSQVALLW